MDDLRYTAKSIWAHELGYREFLEFIANFFLIKRFVIPNSEYGEISQLLSSEIFYVATFSLSENVFCTCYSWVNSCNVLLLLQLIQVQKNACMSANTQCVFLYVEGRTISYPCDRSEIIGSTHIKLTTGVACTPSGTEHFMYDTICFWPLCRWPVYSAVYIPFRTVSMCCAA